MQKKTPAYYKYLQDMAGLQLSYYDVEEIEDAAYDLVDDGKLEDACSLLEHGLRLHPADETLELLQIWLLMHTHRVPEAEAMFEKYKDEDSDVAIRLRFEFDIYNGHPHKAMSDFLAALHRGKVPPADWMQTVNEMFESLNPEVVTPYLIMSMDFLQDNADAWGQLGGLLMDLRQTQQATIALEHAIDIDAYNIYCWQDLARCYLMMGDEDKCAEASEYGLAIDPKNPILNFTCAYIHFSKEEYKEAIPLFEISRQFIEGKLKTECMISNEFELRDQANTTYYMLGECYRKTGQHDKATECLEILCERNPNDTESILGLSTIYLEKGDTPHAEKLIDDALRIHPKNNALLALKVTVLTTMHKFEEALLELDKLIALKPRTYNYRIAKAQLCLSLGKDEEGDRTFRQLLNLNPKDKQVRQMLIDYFSIIDDKDALQRLGKNK